MRSVQRIILRAPNPLGDVVMAEPAMRAIAERFPDAEIVVAAPNALLPLVRGFAFAHRVIAADRPDGIGAVWSQSRMWRAARADIAVLFPNSLGTALVALLGRARRRVGYARDGRTLLLTDRVTMPANPRAEHMVDYYARLARALDAMPDGVPRLAADPAARAVARKLTQGRRDYVVLAPGAAYGPAKQWPYYEQLARALADQGRDVVVVGSAGEKALCEQVAGGHALSLAGRTDLAALIAVIDGAAAFIGNDAGAAHIAAALGKTTVAIFGSTDDHHSGPVGPNVRIAHLHLECSPCFARECPLGHLNCLKQIGVDQVLATLRAG